LAILVLLNNFLHDLGAAGWLFGAVLLWCILRKGSPAGPALIDILKTVLLLMRLSVGAIVIFGIIRAVAYKSYEWNATAGQSQVTLIIVKHVVFTGLFVLGLVYYIKANTFIKSIGDEEAE
jgi:hypothetical protein